MASSSFKSNPQHHVRSINLPSRLTPQVDENLSRLRASEVTSTSLTSIGNRLCVLENMFDSLDDFLLLSNTQKGLLKNEKLCEEVLNGYLRLLDLCSMAKDSSLTTKEDVQSLLSSLRRRRDGDELELYLNSRKQTKKEIQKSLKDLRSMKNKLKNKENEGSLFQEVGQYHSARVFDAIHLWLKVSIKA